MLPGVFDETIQLTDSQRAGVLERARKLMWEDLNYTLIGRVTLAGVVCIAIVWLVSCWIVFRAPSPILMVPALAVQVAIGQHPVFRRPSDSSLLAFRLYLLIAFLIFVIALFGGGLVAIVMNVVAIVLISLLARLMFARTFREYVRLAMVDLKFDEVCMACGYRLHTLGKTVIRCPECGEVRYFTRPAAGSEPVVLEK